MNLDQDAKSSYFLKRQSTPAVIHSLHKYNCIVIRVPNNHTNLFRSIDISVNKNTRCSIADKYQEGYACEVLKQCMGTHDKKVNIRLITIKPLQTNWLIQSFHYIKASKNVFSGFKKAHINVAVKKAHFLIKVCENPFENIAISLWFSIIWQWWWWWWWIVFVVWMTKERRLALFSAGAIVRYPHHRKSLTCRGQGLNLRRTWVQAWLNEVVQ